MYLSHPCREATLIFLQSPLFHLITVSSTPTFNSLGQLTVPIMKLTSSSVAAGPLILGLANIVLLRHIIFVSVKGGDVSVLVHNHLLLQWNTESLLCNWRYAI